MCPLDHAEDANPTRQHELDHTDITTISALEYILIDHFYLGGVRCSVRRVQASNPIRVSSSGRECYGCRIPAVT